MTDAVKKEKKVMTPEKLEQLARARAKALEIRKAGAAIKAEHKELAEAALNEKIEEERQVKEAVKIKLVAKKAENFKPTPECEIENKIIKDKLVENPVTQEYVPEYSPRVEVQPPVLCKPAKFEESDSESDLETPPKPIKPVTAEGLATASRKPIKSKKPIKTKIVIEQSSDDEDEFHPHEHVIFVKRKSKNDSKAKIVPVVIPAATPAPNVSPVRGNRNEIPVYPQQAQRQLPTYPLGNTMDDFVNAGFANYRKYY